MRNLQSASKCSECVVRSKSIFKKLSLAELEILDTQKRCNVFKRGSIVYREGTRITGFYCVNSGIIKLVKTGMDLKEQIIRFAQSGDIIGFRSVVSNDLACTTAKVIEEAELCFIPSEFLFQVIRQNAHMSFELMQLTCKELGEANQFITDIAQKSVRERLAEILMILKKTFGLDEQNTLKISLTREELANMVGTATESVIRLLSEFKNDKLIEVNGRKIKILEPQQLMKIANIMD